MYYPSQSDYKALKGKPNCFSTTAGREEKHLVHQI